MERLWCTVYKYRTLTNYINDGIFSQALESGSSGSTKPGPWFNRFISLLFLLMKQMSELTHWKTSALFPIVFYIDLCWVQEIYFLSNTKRVYCQGRRRGAPSRFHFISEVRFWVLLTSKSFISEHLQLHIIRKMFDTWLINLVGEEGRGAPKQCSGSLGSFLTKLT